MKKTRRFAAFAASVLAVACMAAPMSGVLSADAAGTYKITVNNTVTGYTYTASQIFTGSFDGTVLGNIVWGSGVSTLVDGEAVAKAGLVDAIQKIDVDGAKPFAGKSTAADIAKVLSDAASALEAAEPGSSHDATIAKKFADAVAPYATATATDDYKDSKYEFTGLDAGYYLVQNTVIPGTAGTETYTRYILKVAGEDASVTPKGEYPTLEKKVLENVKYTGKYTHENGTTDYTTAAKYNDVADYNIGDIVKFELIGTLPDNLDDYDKYKYIFEDTLSEGLTLDADTIKVYIVNDGTLDTETALTSGDATYTTDAADGAATFKISFADISAIDGVTGNSMVIVQYDAELNEKAVIGLDGNPNQVNLTYSSNPNNDGANGPTNKTPDEYVIVFTYELDVTKYLAPYEEGGASNTTADDQEGTKAGFKLYNADGKAAVIENGRVSGWSEEGVEVTTDSYGKFSFIGLDDGTYILKETTTPKGYNTMKDMTLVVKATTKNGDTYMETDMTPSAVLTALNLYENSADTANGGKLLDTAAATGNNANGIVDTIIVNEKGSNLPSTGGMGTTLFYVGGGALALGAGVLLVTKKRMSNK
ncbi:MAG: isopeptide-forming domain-containing fimbrial protein [Ruminococcus sp.]|nr:isopeptide-forming domain-containing fimbrial protein [Ruminococcus sp.]